MSTIEETTATTSPCGILLSSPNETPSIEAEIFRVKVDKLMALLEAEKRLVKEPFGTLEELAKHAEDAYWDFVCAKTDCDLAYETDLTTEQVRQIREAFGIRDGGYRNTQILSKACTYVANLAKKHVDLTKKYETVCEDSRRKSTINSNKLDDLVKKVIDLEGELKESQGFAVRYKNERDYYQNKFECTNTTLNSCIWLFLPIAAAAGAGIAVTLMRCFG